MKGFVLGHLTIEIAVLHSELASKKKRNKSTLKYFS